LAALKEEDRAETWYADWVEYQAKHRLYAGVLSPKAYSSHGCQLDLLRLTRFWESFAYFSPAHAYSLHVSFLGLFPILMSANEPLKRESVARLEGGGLFAFGVSERAHGADLLANEFTVRDTPAGRVADGAKCYIGNANAAGLMSVLGKKGGTNRRSPLVLVAHSGAGYLLPQLGVTQRAARRAVGGYVFLDAGIPAPRPSTRLDLLAAEHPAMADDLDVLLAAGGRFPPWTADDLRELVPDEALRTAVVDSVRPRGRDFFTEVLPFPTGEIGWPDAPCGLLQTSAAYAATARSARSRGWPVIERDGGHFASCVDPHGVARDLLALVDRM